MKTQYCALFFYQVLLIYVVHGDPPVSPPVVTPTTPTPTTPTPTTMPTTPTPTTPTPTTTPTTPTPTTTPTTPTPTTPTPTTTPTTTTPTTPTTPATPTTPTVPSTTAENLISPELLSQLKQSLTIYYGAMDENSQLFFNITLTKTLNVFHPYFDFNYIPCQKVQILQGELFCFAQGDPTCYLDKIHACAVAQIVDKKQLSQFLACTMTTTYTFPDLNKCSTSCGINFKNLEACACSDVGKRLCINFNKQKIPDCNTAPGFVFKKPSDILKPEDFDNFENNSAFEDFLGTLCGKLRQSKTLPLPAECQKKLLLGVYYNVQDEPSQKWFHSVADFYEKYAPFYTIKYHPCMFADLVGGKMACKSDADKECFGEKMHACALMLVPDPIVSYKFQTCTMSDPKKLGDFEKCANDNQIDFKGLKNCADSELGNHLCYEYSKKRPNTDKVPAFAFEANFNGAINEETSKDPKFVLCQQLRYYEVTRMDDCKGSIKLSIFYQSTNYDFQCSMSSTIASNYEKFASYVEFDFVPCRNVKEDGPKLKCENSLDPECTVDKFQACSVKYIKDKFILYKVLQCLSQEDNGKLPSPQACATAFQADFNALQTCANGDEGKALCLENQKRAPKNDDPISVQINDAWDPEVDKQIREDFTKGICDSLKRLKTPYPNECF